MRDDIGEGISGWAGASPAAAPLPNTPPDQPPPETRLDQPRGNQPPQEPAPDQPSDEPQVEHQDREQEDRHPDTVLGDGPVMTYTVKELKISDRGLLDSILDQFQPGWEGDLAPGATGSLAFVADSATFAFGSFLGAEPVGYAWGYRLRLPTGRRSLLLHDLEVAQDHRGQGLGSLLLRAVLNLGEREGCAQVWLVTEADNQTAIDMYEGSGGVAPSKPAGDLVYEWLFEVNRWIPRRR